jgi:transmembrane sensor
LVAPPPNAIDEIAAAWVARIDRAPLSPDDQHALDTWMAASPRHAGALARASAMNLYLDKAAALGPAFDPDRGRTWRMPSFGMDRRQMLIGGSTMALAVVGTGLSYAVLTQKSRVSTGKGVIQRHPLADGSSMTLNTATEVAVAFDSAVRKVELLDGEARFDVIKDAARPFLVLAGDVTVRAIGTSFSVWRNSGSGTRVVVSEGIVEVVSAGKMLANRLTAGRMLHLDDGGAIVEKALSPYALEQVSAWTSGMVDMNGLSLREAAQEFGRYSETRIELQDAAVANLRVSGVYSINNPVGFARDAALSLGLEAVSGDGSVLIRRK